MMAFQPHPTPPQKAFSEIYWRSQLLGIPNHGLAAAAPGHGQVVALGAKKVALGPAPHVRVRPRSRSAPLVSAPLGHGLAPPPPGHGNAQYLGTPGNLERPVNFRKRHLGWGGVGTRRPPNRMIILIILGLSEACLYFFLDM